MTHMETALKVLFFVGVVPLLLGVLLASASLVVFIGDAIQAAMAAYGTPLTALGLLALAAAMISPLVAFWWNEVRPR